jgi:hypothetical protein
MKYTKVVYPKADPVIGYTAPIETENYLYPLFQSATWNPFSENEADRFEFWADDNGTLLFEEAFKIAFGIDYVAPELDVLT